MLNNTLWACEPRALQTIAALFARHNPGPLLVSQAAGEYQRHQSTAVIELSGVLMPNPPQWAVADRLASRPQDIGAAANAARVDGSIDQVLLLVDSPGGSIDGVDEAAKAVARLSQEKRVVTQVRGMMASAALYIGSQGSEVRAARTDLIGSIGTRLSLWDISGMFEKDGIRVISIDTGEMKSAGEPGLPITDDQVSYFQTLVSGFQQFFQEAVLSGRGMTEEQYQRVSDGRVWLAGVAQQLGLVDRIATQDETIRALIGNKSGSNRRVRAAFRMRLQRQSRVLTGNNYR